MFSTFNMGIGMIMVVDPKDAEGVTALLQASGEKPSVIGKITAKEGIEIINGDQIL